MLACPNSGRLAWLREPAACHRTHPVPCNGRQAVRSSSLAGPSKPQSTGLSAQDDARRAHGCTRHHTTQHHSRPAEHGRWRRWSSCCALGRAVQWTWPSGLCGRAPSPCRAWPGCCKALRTRSGPSLPPGEACLLACCCRDMAQDLHGLGSLRSGVLPAEVLRSGMLPRPTSPPTADTPVRQHCAGGRLLAQHASCLLLAVF